MMRRVRQSTYGTVAVEAKIGVTLKDVEFECGHIRRFEPRYAPLTGELVYCSRCADYRKALGEGATEWYVRCEVCTYGRRYGEDEYAAYSASRRHRHNTTVTRIPRKVA